MQPMDISQLLKVNIDEVRRVIKNVKQEAKRQLVIQSSLNLNPFLNVHQD